MLYLEGWAESRSVEMVELAGGGILGEELCGQRYGRGL